MEQIVGKGNTAVIYKYGDRKVLKFFNIGYSPEAVQREYANAKLMNALPFDKPIAYHLVEMEGRIGIVYDYVAGTTLQEWVLDTMDLAQCAAHLARAHKQFMDSTLKENKSLPHYKDFIRQCLDAADSANGTQEETSGGQKHIRDLLAQLPEGDTLCHGDFHPGNVMLSLGKTDCLHIIDFMNVCLGTRLYDVARTYYLIACTPVPEFAEDKEGFMALKQELAHLYLVEMGVTREEVAYYLLIITAARKGES